MGKSDKDKYSADLANWNAKDDSLNKRNLDKMSIYKQLTFFFIKDYYLIGLLNKLLVESKINILTPLLCQFLTNLFTDSFIQDYKLV